MQNVADVQEMEVSGAGGEVVADAGLADRAVAVAVLAAAVLPAVLAVLAVATRPSAGSAISSDRRRRDVCNVSPR
jgi:hypothetical protein